MSIVYFITHPDVEIDPSIPVTDWSLSDTGITRMQKMLSLDWVSSIDHLFSSTEKKAIDGAQIVSRELKIPFKTIEDLGENDRSSTGYLPAAEFEVVADQFFAEPSKSVRGWETASDAQSRIVRTTNKILQNKNSKAVTAIVSHGAVGTLLMCYLNNWPISRQHDQPGNGGGNFFSFESSMDAIHSGWLAIDATGD